MASVEQDRRYRTIAKAVNYGASRMLSVGEVFQTLPAAMRGFATPKRILLVVRNERRYCPWWRVFRRRQLLAYQAELEIITKVQVDK